MVLFLLLLSVKSFKLFLKSVLFLGVLCLYFYFSVFSKRVLWFQLWQPICWARSIVQYCMTPEILKITEELLNFLEYDEYFSYVFRVLQQFNFTQYFCYKLIFIQFKTLLNKPKMGSHGTTCYLKRKIIKWVILVSAKASITLTLLNYFS